MFHAHEVGRTAFPMDGLGPSGLNPINRNIDNFGGEGFYVHKGQACHRGANPMKTQNIHPTVTAKRVMYQNDGSGRDGYIAQNNGGFTVTGGRPLYGTSPDAQHVNSLRQNVKDNTTPSYHRVSMPLRIADNYIDKNLRVEHADFSQGYSR